MPKTISKTGLAALMTAGKETPAASDAEETVIVPEGEQIVEGANDAPEAEASAPDAEGTVDTPSPELVLLQEKYDASQVELAEAATAATAAEEAHTAQVEALEAAHAKQLDPMKEIIVAQINTMRTALSLTSVDMSAFSPEAILTEFDAISKTFEKSLVIGGIVPNEEGATGKATLTREDNQGLNALNF